LVHQKTNPEEQVSRLTLLHSTRSQLLYGGPWIYHGQALWRGALSLLVRLSLFLLDTNWFDLRFYPTIALLLDRQVQFTKKIFNCPWSFRRAGIESTAFTWICPSHQARRWTYFRWTHETYVEYNFCHLAQSRTNLLDVAYEQNHGLYTPLKIPTILTYLHPTKTAKYFQLLIIQPTYKIKRIN